MEKILLTGDNTPFLESIEEEFKKLGFTALTAGEEEKAFEVIEEESPDVLVITMGTRRFNPLKLVFKLRDVNLLSKLVYLHPDDLIPSPPDKRYFLFVPDSLSPELIVTKIIEKIDSTQPMGEMSIREVLWLLKVEKQSALLRILTDDTEGEIFVVEGNPIACKLGLDIGDEAFESLIKYEGVAYEIIWQVPEGVERNIVKDYEDFFGPPVKKPSKEESEPEEGIDDLSRELELEIQELGIEKGDEDISLEEFPALEEEKWDLGEETLKEMEETGSEEDLSDLFKEEKDEFPTGLEEELKSEEKERVEKPESPEGFTFPDEELEEFPSIEEERIDFQESGTREKSEDEFPPAGEEQLTEFPPVEKEKMEFSPSPDVEEEKIPLFEEPMDTEKEEPLEGSEFQVPGEETEELQVPGDFEIPEDVTEEASPVIEESEKPVRVETDETLQKRLEETVRGLRGLERIGLLKEKSVVAGIPDQSLYEAVEKFVFEDFDEAFKRSGSSIVVSVKRGDLVIWALWKGVPAGYALFETRRIFNQIQA